MIRWFAQNPVAANLLMMSLFVLGAWSTSQRMVVEFFPSVTVDSITVRVPYRGATPAEVEESIVVRIEEAVQDLEGIEDMNSSAAENVGSVTIEVESGYAPRELLDDVKNRVDAISTFPDDIDRPVYTLAQIKREVISVILAAKTSEDELRHMAEMIRDDLLKLDGITQVDINAIRQPELAIEINEHALRRYNVTLNQVADAISRQSQDLPAGAIDTRSGEILIRTLGQAYTAHDFGNIVIRQHKNAVVRVHDVATITDAFEEDPLYAIYNGRRSAILEITRVGDQSALDISAKVKDYVSLNPNPFGPESSLSYWRDRGRIIQSRLNTLWRSTWQGGILVFILLTLFLRPTLAFWVCLGIPVSFMGALIFMPTVGVSINIISLFGFILVLGIVVDDAIVTGENIFRHIRAGDDPLEATIAGTQEVAVPVTFGVLTTAVAFIPLIMLEGQRGDIFGQLPVVIIPVLLFSLIESKLILPSHLSRMKPLDPNTRNPLVRLQLWFVEGLESIVKRVYQPALAWCLSHKAIALTCFFGLSALVLAYVKSGQVGFQPFPRVASESPSVSLQMPLGTPFEVTAKHIDHITEQVRRLQEKYRHPESGQSVIRNVLSTYGSGGSGRPGSSSGAASHLGQVRFEMVPPEQRDIQINTPEIAREWRRMVGSIPGAESMSYRAEIGRASDPIDIQLSHSDFDVLRQAATDIKSHLGQYTGVFDITDSFESGKQEIQLRLKDNANSLGVTTQQIARQIRHGFFGAEAQRIQRGRDDIRVMVRYPRDTRSRLNSLSSMRITLTDGRAIPLSEVATIDIGRSFASIKRVNRQRTINVTADIDKDNVDQGTIMSALNEAIPPLVNSINPRIQLSMEGEAKETKEMGGSLILGMIILLFLVYALLAIPFKSYGQPLIVMAIIPFGLVGAVLGHAYMGVSMSFPSIFGALALIGVVVNDSLVMVDYINQHRKKFDLLIAVKEAGMARFRPIILTSMTTFAGLMPLLREQSTQAQFLKPMAISLGYGILFATIITLLVVPILYVIYDRTVTKLFKTIAA